MAWLLISRRAAAGRPALPGAGRLPGLVATALVMQVGGNISFQWALPILGLSLSVPLVFGTLILGGALAGRACLGEPIFPRTALAMMVLMAAIGVLSWGAETARPIAGPQAAPTLIESDAAAVVVEGGLEFDSWTVAMAVITTCFSGFCYAASSIVIRRMSDVVPLSATIMVMSTTGVISLGAITLWRIGWAGMTATTPHEWTTMLLAGAFNAVAFFSLGIALERMPVTRTNLINASQVALSAVAGIVLFGEKPTAAIVAGIVLTVLGLSLLRRRE